MQPGSSTWIMCGTQMQAQGAGFISMSFGLKNNTAQVNRCINASFNICFYLHVSWEIYTSEVLLLPVIKGWVFLNLEACHTHRNNEAESYNQQMQKETIKFNLYLCLLKKNVSLKKLITYHFCLLTWPCGKRHINWNGSELLFRYIIRQMVLDSLYILV